MSKHYLHHSYCKYNLRYSHCSAYSWLAKCFFVDKIELYPHFSGMPWLYLFIYLLLCCFFTDTLIPIHGFSYFCYIICICWIAGDELLSDSFPYKETENGMLWEVEGKVSILFKKIAVDYYSHTFAITFDLCNCNM